MQAKLTLFETICMAASFAPVLWQCVRMDMRLQLLRWRESRCSDGRACRDRSLRMANMQVIATIEVEA